MASQPPIPIPEEFDQLDLADKRAYLTALRARLEDSLDADASAIEDAIFEEIERRRAGAADGTRRLLTRDELMGPLRASYRPEPRLPARGVAVVYGRRRRQRPD